MDDLYKIKLQLRIDWSEMDVFGHVNNVMFMKYIQASRVNYWEIAGLGSSAAKPKTGPILASTSCQFKKPLYYPGSITVMAKVDYIKNTSFGISHIILNDQNEIVAEAQDVVVIFDFEKNEKMNFPDWLRKKVEFIEEKTF